ncbi:MAG: Nif3-like dinuclear metal center hexameric protein [Hydrogenoanaerobacterium sp.]
MTETALTKIYNAIDSFAPFCKAEEWDNCGILLRGENENITKALLALDITAKVIEEAQAIGAELIISHHPVIFDPIKNINCDSPVYLLAKHGISAICAHTSLDASPNGVNKALAERLGLKNIQALTNGKNDIESSEAAFGSIGELTTELVPKAFAELVKNSLSSGGVCFTPYSGGIKKVAVCGGAGAEFMLQATQNGAQAFVTGEAKHHQLLQAQSLKIMLVSAGHYATESVVLAPLREMLKKALAKQGCKNIEFIVSQCEKDPALYL